MPKSVIFVDSRVADYQSLMDSFVEPAEVFVLDGESDGLAQIVAYLQGRTGIDAIHVISHGSMGALYLGGTVLNSSNVALHGSQLASIGGALTETGDILLYGCNVAQGDVGLQFITSLAQYTGADVAASVDATGAAALGGDWVLERTLGRVEALQLPAIGVTALLATNTAPTFVSSIGRVSTAFSTGSYEVANSLAVQADGKILMGGYSYGSSTKREDFALVRYNADGSLDPSFDGDGKVTTDVESNSNDVANSLALQADGKILLGGYSYTAGYERFALVRYNTDGSLDTSFDFDGRVTTAFGAYSHDWGSSVTVQVVDGKILLGGYSYISSTGYYNFALVRYNADGRLDTSFDGDGKVTTALSSYNDKGSSVVVQADGKILLGGSTISNGYEAFALVRYNADGRLDTSFDGDGKVTSDFGAFGGRGASVTVQADGRILLGGSTISYGATTFALARYNADGSLDTSFDFDGKLTTEFRANSSSSASSVMVQGDGKILLGGYGYGYGNSSESFALVRYNADGSLDTSFDGDGKVTTAFGELSYDRGTSVTLQADGKILLGGYSGTVANFDFALARYNADGSLDASFSIPRDTLAEPLIYVESIGDYVRNGRVLAWGARIIDAELAAANSYNGATLTLSRHTGANDQDVFSAKSGGTLSTLTPSSYFAIDSITVGRVTTNSAGILTMTFNTNATQSLVNSAMQQIAYANSSDAPPATVQIDWTFNDGNTGAQGTGGALSVTGSTTVQITATNDSPILSVPLVDQNLTANTAFSYTVPASAFTDPDLETLTYSAGMADGTGVPPWLSFNASTRMFSGTPGTVDIGSIDIRVTAKDSANASVSDAVRLTVTAPDTAPPIASAFSPVDEATNVDISSNVVLTFNEAIARGVGNIVLKTAASIAVATYDAASSTNLTVAGNTLTINPTSDLSNGTSYKVEFAVGTIKDLAGNSYAGTTSYNFTTVGATTQTFNGSTGNDSLTGSAGNDNIDGGAGTDTVVYSGSRSSYALTKTSAGFTVIDRIGTAGTDTLLNVERLKFSDGAIALDVGATQSAGQTVLLLGAVLGTLIFDASKQALLGAAIDLFDQGYNLQTLSGAVMRLPIWDVLTQKSAPTNTDIATHLLTILNRVRPDAATLTEAVVALDTETDFATQGNFLWHLAESTANQTQIGLVGLASTGLAFTV